MTDDIGRELRRLRGAFLTLVWVLLPLIIASAFAAGFVTARLALPGGP